MGVKMFYDFEVVDGIHKLSAEAAKVKNEIFKASITKRGINDDILRNFISYINNFLRQWDDHCEELAKEMATSSGVEKVRTLEYQFAKDYIYADYDYASVLQFTDGVMKGITSGKFTEPTDIEEFYTHTVQKAFDDQPDTAAGLLESVLQKNLMNINGVTTDKYQAKMYDTIKKHKGIHDSRDRVELYKASVKTIDFIRDDFNPSTSLGYNNVRIFISAINNIIDYIVYSITAFVGRIYVISQYAGPFIRNEVSGVIYKEGTSIENVAITTMKNMDDALTHDHEKIEELMKTLGKFVSDIGADSLFTNKPEFKSYIIGEDDKGSEFCNKLISNPLMEFFNDKDQYLPSGRDSSSINKINNTLKSLAYNPYQGIDGMTTGKQEMMHVIRGVGSDAKSSKELQELAKGLYIFALRVGRIMDVMIKDFLYWRKDEHELPYRQVADINRVSECIKITGELYRDIMSAVVEKAREIENKYNIVTAGDLEKISGDLSIKIPGNLDKQHDLTNNVANVVPDTMRIPMELMDMYSLPAFESARMYDDFLRTLPEFEDSYYLREAADVIDILISFLDGLRRKIDAFFANKSVKKAVEWVKEHRNELDNMQFAQNDKMTDTIIFKEKIELPKGYNNLIDGVKNFTEKNAESADAISGFIKSLYPNDTIYNWFNSADTKDKASKMFQVLFLSNVTIEKVNSEKLTAIPKGTISGADYQKFFKMWVDTVASGYDVYEQYKKLDDSLRADIKNMKNKIVQISSKENEKKDTNDMSSAANNTGTTAGTNEKQKEENVVKDAKPAEVKVEGNNGGNTSSPAANIMGQVRIVMSNIWEPIGKLMCQSIQTQYKYLRDTYTAKKNQQASNTASNNAK